MPVRWGKIIPIPQDVRIAAMNAVKYEGRSAVDVASQYGISSKSISGWLKREVDQTGVDNRDVYREVARLKRENVCPILGGLVIVSIDYDLANSEHSYRLYSEVPPTSYFKSCILRVYIRQ